MGYSKITPEFLDNYINFFYENDSWHYSKEQDNIMPKLQIEGAAKAWNLLLDHNIALLADEVGMGKTIQALAMITTLWLQKPNAKILLYAPNENVAKKWINEYNNFVRYHYRISDDLIKSSLNQSPLRIPKYCENHLALMKNTNMIWPSLFVCKTSSLSGFASKKITQERINDLGINVYRNIDNEVTDEKQQEWMAKFALACNKHLYKKLSDADEPPFDLLIFDEAHYLRRTDSYTNRSIVAHSLFSGKNILKNSPESGVERIAQKVLLLTATPNHSSPKDVKTIVSLFNPEFEKMEPEEILNTVCIRRFRRLNGLTKHQYREEIPSPVNLNTLREKLFFASYQKSLVDLRSKKKDESKTNNPYRILFGYLEGFEFLPDSRIVTRKKKDKNDDVERESGGDFYERDDVKVIFELSKKYKQAYKERPRHPKYDKIISTLTPLVKSEHYCQSKRLVFVRRIPSVYEISKRLLEDYDNWFISVLSHCIPRKVRKRLNSNVLRKHFWQLANKQRESEQALVSDLDFSENESDSRNIIENDKIPSSIVLDLFTKKREGKHKTNDCSNFRDRFSRKDQLFALFFEPASDYRSGNYNLRKVYDEEGKKLYRKSASYERISKLPDDTSTSRLEDIYKLEEKPKETGALQSNNFSTLLGTWFKMECTTEQLRSLMEKAKLEYEGWTILEKEGFSSYLEKGVLFSSPFIVHLYSYFYISRNTKDKNRGEELYNEFCSQVRANIESMGLAELIANAILTFKIFYRKELSLTPEQLITEKWTFLNHTIPVYPYCGETKRQSIVQAFNTPYFPNVLIATSVLQEGVDLHYHCSEVIHYGIAWTQGDNEQRVGRVDRMFGKLESSLKEDPDSTLPIHFPFLAKTMDEDQMRRFIVRKNDSEQLIDQFKVVEFQSEINYLDRIDDKDWLNCFKKPCKDTTNVEPFGVNNEKDFLAVIPPRIVIRSNKFKENLINPLLDTLKKEFNKEFVSFFGNDNQDEGGTLCKIRHVRPNNRHQPVVFDFDYVEEGMHYIKQPTYCLTIRTPITRRGERYDDLRRFGELRKVYNSNPILKICFDEKSRDMFKYCVSCEIPFFLVNETEGNISGKEILNNTMALIDFADRLEHKLHGGDIKNEEVISGENEWKYSNRLLTEDRIDMNVPPGWKLGYKGIYILKENKIEFKDDLQTAYTFNHKNKFKRITMDSKDSYLQLGIYRRDALAKEIEFLEKVFKAEVFCP